MLVYPDCSRYLGPFGYFFKNCFLFLKQKTQKNLFKKEGVFLFFMFSVFSKITFFLNNKKMFSLFKE